MSHADTSCFQIRDITNIGQKQKYGRQQLSSSDKQIFVTSLF